MMPPLLLLLLLVGLVSSWCMVAVAQSPPPPPSVTLHVALDGADVAGCGTLPDANACLSLRHALSLVPAATAATILMANGTYSGVNNTNIVLTAASPRRIAALHTGGHVVLDVKGTSGLRHFNVMLGGWGTVTPPDWSRITLEGLTLRGGKATCAGSIMVMGDAVNAGAVLRVVDCVFESNHVELSPVHWKEPSAGAVFVLNAVLPGSAQSVRNQSAMSPPGPNVQPNSIPATTGTAPPMSPYATDAWADSPPVPTLAEDGRIGTFLPAVIFQRCVFAGNKISFGTEPMIISTAAGSIAVHQSVVAVMDCTFRAHPPPVVVLALLTGVGATWVHRCTFENVHASSIGVTVSDSFLPLNDSHHYLVVSESRFLGLSALAAPIPSIADMLGGQIGSVIIHFGYGSVTLIDTHIVNNIGTAITAGAAGSFRMYGGSFTGGRTARQHCGEKVSRLLQNQVQR